jgi:hypothetical protein
MDIVEVKLLKYVFKFRKLPWREEFGIKFDPQKDRLRTLLACALTEVSGVRVGNFDDAWRVISPLPDPIIKRVYVIYKGSLPEPRFFTTLGLYKAPVIKHFMRQIEQTEQESEQIMDKVEREMTARFGRKEVEEAMAVEREMAKKSKLRGMTPATQGDRDAN